MLKTIGTDPEYFMVDDSGKLISSIGMIPGSKKDPFDIGDGIKVHPDNIAIELSVPPADNEDAFVAQIHKAISRAQSFVSSVNPKAYIKKDLVSVYPSQEILKGKGARSFGCEPDFNAWKMEINTPPSSKTKLRSCGGHIHVGLSDELINDEFIRIAVLMMDIYLGIPSIVLDQDKDRRSIYGKASCFRPKDYGFEYRTLSNFWTKSDDLIKWVFKNTNTAIQAAKEINHYDFNLLSETVEIINNQDSEKAKTFITLLNINMP